MDAFLSAALFKHEYVRDGRFNFSQKAQMCRALSLGEDTDDLWEVIWGINSVRNQVAHDLDVDEIRKKMDKLRKTFFDTSAKNPRKKLLLRMARELAEKYL